MKNYRPKIYNQKLVIKKFRCENCRKLNQFEKEQDEYTCIKCGGVLGVSKK